MHIQARMALYKTQSHTTCTVHRLNFTQHSLTLGNAWAVVNCTHLANQPCTLLDSAAPLTQL